MSTPKILSIYASHTVLVLACVRRENVLVFVVAGPWV